jgi:hypothetical protein
MSKPYLLPPKKPRGGQGICRAPACFDLHLKNLASSLEKEKGIWFSDTKSEKHPATRKLLNRVPPVLGVGRLRT